MAHSIKTVYVVHHSHTDIGYTDLQERVIAIQVNYIKTVLSMMRQPECRPPLAACKPSGPGCRNTLSGAGRSRAGQLDAVCRAYMGTFFYYYQPI